MKKLLLALVMMLAISQLTYAQDVKSIMKEFKKQEGAEYISVPRLMMSFAKQYMDDDDEDDRIAKKVRSVQILTLDDCKRDVRARFVKEIRGLCSNGYETMVQVTDDGEKVDIFVKRKKDTIRQLGILCLAGEDCALINIDCKIKEEDIAQMVDMQISKNR